MRRLVRAGLAAAAAGGFLSAVGCSDDETAPEPPLILAKAPQSGDNQAALVGEQLPFALRVVVTRDDEPVEDVEVVWNAGGNGSMTPESSTTDANGIAESFWTLGTAPGQQSATARAPESDQAPISFTATAEAAPEGPPPPTALRAPAGTAARSP